MVPVGPQKIFASKLANINYISICTSEGVSFTEYSCLQLKMKIRRIKIKKIVHPDASFCNEEQRSSLAGRVFDNHANIKKTHGSMDHAFAGAAHEITSHES